MVWQEDRPPKNSLPRWRTELYAEDDILPPTPKWRKGGRYISQRLWNQVHTILSEAQHRREGIPSRDKQKVDFMPAIEQSCGSENGPSTTKNAPYLATRRQ